MPDALDRLDTWAAIAAHLGRDVRTTKRYEAERSLPVHRVPGGGKATVYAFRWELDAWLRRVRDGDTSETDTRPPEAEPQRAPEPRRRLRISALTAAISCLGLALMAGAGWAVKGSVARAHTPSSEAKALTREGVYAWNRRTPEGLAQAIDSFTRAVVLDPKDTAAYVGLADSYNLGPEFSSMRPEDAYPRARAAALRALALSPDSAAAHRALGFVDFWWRQDAERGLTELREAARLAPGSALTHHWLANMLAVRGDPAALKEIEAAFALEPDTPVLADKGFVLVMLGRFDEAKPILLKVAALQPDYAAVHDYLLVLSRRLGDEASVLREARLAAQLRHQTALAAAMAIAERSLASGGTQAALQEVAAQQDQLRSVGESDSFQTALAESELHRRQSAIAWLSRARAEHHPAILSLSTNPDFAWLRSDPSFQKLSRAA